VVHDDDVGERVPYGVGRAVDRPVVHDDHRRALGQAPQPAYGGERLLPPVTRPDDHRDVDHATA
jgi:hypothetical protein